MDAKKVMEDWYRSGGIIAEAKDLQEVLNILSDCGIHEVCVEQVKENEDKWLVHKVVKI